MMSKMKEPARITRKDFLKKSCKGLSGLIAYDVLRKGPLDLKNQDKHSMQKRTLGRSGIQAATLGYGAARSMEPALLLAALDQGINFIDTGRNYFNGNNERMIGQALKGIRKEVIIQSKMRVRLNSRDSQNSASQALWKNMESSLEASLKALQTDYIDIMLIHDAEKTQVLENATVMEFFSSAKKKGCIRAHGFSCHDEIELLQSANESGFYDIIMLPYNHKGSYVHMLSGNYYEWDQPRVEIELEKAHKKNLGVVAMKTCSAGPYAPDGVSKASYAGAIKWVLDHSYISVAAVAMSNFAEIQEDIKSGVGPG
jgi:aryl-alcohol dehydrogenase-like predicted oxidoreductase